LPRTNNVTFKPQSKSLDAFSHIKRKASNQLLILVVSNKYREIVQSVGDPPSAEISTKPKTKQTIFCGTDGIG